MMNRFLAWLFACKHERTTLPLTKGRLTYVCCLECGAEKLYDWKQMKEGIAIEPGYTMAFFRGYSVNHKLVRPVAAVEISGSAASEVREGSCRA